MLFWRKGNSGYTTNINEAGLYTKEEAQSINSNRSTDIPWEENYVKNNLQQTCDMQDVDIKYLGILC